MSLWQKISLSVFIAILVVGLVVVLVVVTPHSSDIKCENIHLQVSDYDQFQFISEHDVETQLKNQGNYPIGHLHSDIDLTAMEQSLEQLNMVKGVTCYFTSNGDVRVSVTQRVPVFRVMYDGVDYYVDTDRKRMRTSIRFSAYVPVVTGYVDFEFASTELYDFIVYLQSESRWRSAFTQINICNGSEIELIPRVGDFVVRLGSLERYESKLEKLDKFLSVLPKYHSWDKYSVINLEFRDQVVCTKRRK
jgi:cell division protein FtsQ